MLRLIFIRILADSNLAVSAVISVMYASFSPLELMIFAWLPVSALFRTMALMLKRLPEHSYFSCLNRSGKQDHKEADSSKRTVVCTRIAEFIFLYIIWLFYVCAGNIRFLFRQSLCRGRQHFFQWFLLPLTR